MSDEESKFLTSSEAAREFGVDPKTVTRWARNGMIAYYTTPGGHRRYAREDVASLMKRTPKRV